MIFSGYVSVGFNGDGFSRVVFISAGGADLSQFNISGGRATVTITKVPAPASLLGPAGRAATRRRSANP